MDYWNAWNRSGGPAFIETPECNLCTEENRAKVESLGRIFWLEVSEKPAVVTDIK
jgi:hypothetical protein